MRFLLGVVAVALGGGACAGGETAAKDTRLTEEASSALERPGGAEGAGAATGSAPSTAGALPAAAIPGVLIVGTSLTAGLGLDPDDAYPAVLQRMADSAGYKVRVTNAGLSGETSAGALRRLDWLLRERAELVVVETGANDGLRGLDPDSTKANLVGIVRAIRAALPEVPIVLVQMEAPPNLGAAYTRRFREMYREVARAEGATLAPFLLEGVAGEARLNQSDGIHPSEEGAEVAARNLWPVLEPLLRALGRPG